MRIFLLGFMGSGKTFTGSRVAMQMGCSFLDLDDKIEAYHGKSIPEIFRDEGESHFRLLEREALHRMAAFPEAVISCGGGTPCFFDNVRWMNDHGITIYLRASPEILYQRLLPQRQQRPLLSRLKDEDLLDFIRSKLRDREKFYLQANYSIDQDSPDSDAAAAILKVINGL